MPRAGRRGVRIPPDLPPWQLLATTELTRLEHRDGDGDLLLVMFGAIDDPPWQPAHEALRLAPVSAHSFGPDEMAALDATLRTVIRPGRRVVTLGTGPGGHAALRHARLLGARLVLAVSPSSADADEAAISARSIPPDCDAFVLFDPARPDEAADAARIAAHASVALTPAAGSGLLTDRLDALLEIARARKTRGQRQAAISALLAPRPHAPTPHASVPRLVAEPPSLAEAAARIAAGDAFAGLRLARRLAAAHPTDPDILAMLAAALRLVGEPGAADALDRVRPAPPAPAG